MRTCQGSLIDPTTDEPFESLVVDTSQPAATNGDWTGTDAVAPDGSFVVDGVINFSSDASGFLIEDGNFIESEGTPDALFPGLPGADDDTFTILENGQNFSIEVLTFVELPAGEVTLGVHHDDAVELAIHPNDARDLFRQQNRRIRFQLRQSGSYREAQRRRGRSLFGAGSHGAVERRCRT